MRSVDDVLDAQHKKQARERSVPLRWFGLECDTPADRLAVWDTNARPRRFVDFTSTDDPSNDHS